MKSNTNPERITLRNKIFYTRLLHKFRKDVFVIVSALAALVSQILILNYIYDPFDVMNCKTNHFEIAYLGIKQVVYYSKKIKISMVKLKRT